MNLFASIVSQPALPESSLNRERDRLRIGLLRKKQSPGDIASDLFFNLTYGSHPYAHAAEGEEKYLDRISRSDLTSFHKQFYVGSNAVLAIMGDLSKREAKNLWKSGEVTDFKIQW